MSPGISWAGRRACQWLGYRTPFEDEQVRDRLRVMLNEIDGVELDRSALQRRPSFPVSLLRDQDQRARFYRAIEWFLETARGSQEESA